MIIPKIKPYNKTYYLLLLLLGLILISPVIDTKLIPGHDYIFHVSRIEAVAEALKQGVFPVRMYVDSVQFWGTPVGIFYPGLFNYIPALLSLIGIPVEICYNIYIALIIFLGLFSSWYGFSLLTRSKFVGLLSVTLYVSSGYYLFDAYIRNALGELLSLSFMPLAIACITYIFNKPKITIKIYLLAILSISAIIESHVLNTVFLALFSALYFIISYRKITCSKFKKIVFLVIILLLLNACFIIPFLTYYEKVPLSIHFINEFSQSGFKPTVLFKFFILWNTWLFIAIYIFLSHGFHNIKHFTFFEHKQYNYYRKFLITGLFFLFVSSSLFPWDYLPPLKKSFKIMQFSWRFIGQASLFLSVCGGFGLYLFLKKIKLNVSTLALFTAIICVYHLIAFKYLTPTIYGNIAEKCYWRRTVFATDEDYLYKDMDVNLLFKQKNRFISDAKITNWEKNLTDILFTYETYDHDSKIILPLVNYPGYNATDHTGKIIQIAENENHMMVIHLPKGNGTIKIKYDPKLFKASDIITLIASVILIYHIMHINYKKSWEKIV